MTPAKPKTVTWSCDTLTQSPCDPRECVYVCQQDEPSSMLPRTSQSCPISGSLADNSGGDCGSPVPRTHLVGYIIHHNGCLRPSVVHGCQTMVALLPSCVPDLKFDSCVIQTDGLSQEGSCGRGTENLVSF